MPIKKQGGGIIAERDWKKRLLNWITKNAPKNVDLNKPLDEQVKFKYNPDIDYLDSYQLLPKKVQDVLNNHDFDGEKYSSAKKTIKKLNKLGWTVDYDLSGDLFDLKPLGK